MDVHPQPPQIRFLSSVLKNFHLCLLFLKLLSYRHCQLRFLYIIPSSSSLHLVKYSCRLGISHVLVERLPDTFYREGTPSPAFGGNARLQLHHETLSLHPAIALLLSMFTRKVTLYLSLVHQHFQNSASALQIRDLLVDQQVYFTGLPCHHYQPLEPLTPASLYRNKLEASCLMLDRTKIYLPSENAYAH